LFSGASFYGSPHASGQGVYRRHALVECARLGRFAQELKKQEKMVFLDYKYYDIEETIKNAVARAAEIGIDFLRSAGTHRGRRGRSVGGVIDFPRQRFRRPMASGLTARPNRSLLALLALLAGILQT
jgi:hypothetical protein